MHLLAVLALAIIYRTKAQQTFQSTLFDLPADLPSEDYLFLSELEDAVTKDAKETIKPKKIDKTALGTPQVEPPTLQPSLIQSQYISQPPPAVTLAPFSFPTYPTLPGNAMPSHFTIAPFILPMNFTVPPPPFLLPTHQTLAPIIFPSHPTLPPFQFPTHSTIAPFTITPPSQSPLTSSPQPTQYQMYGSNPQIIQTPQEPQKENALLATLSREPQQNNAVMINTHTQAELPPQQLSHRNGNAAYNQAPHEALNQPSSMQTQFTQLHQYNSYPQQQQQLQEQYKEKLYQHSSDTYQKNYDLHPSTEHLLQQEGGSQPFTKNQGDQRQGIPQLQYKRNSEADSAPVQRVSSSTANRVSIWFKEEFDTKECEKNLSSVAERFREKFPGYLQKGGKNVILSGIVKQRLIECNRKLDTSHWDKVDELLGKISLSKSEEIECRNGLIQERISCINLLHYACQFVGRSFTFRLVPARIIIQEARQAESGAEKCRKVVRMVRKRLEG